MVATNGDSLGEQRKRKLTEHVETQIKVENEKSDMYLGENFPTYAWCEYVLCHAQHVKKI